MRSLYKKSQQTNLESLLKLFSEDGIFLSLVGVFNVESGHLSVRTERFNEVTQNYTGAFRECDKCVPQEEGRLFFSTCDTCGKNESNYFWIPSGDGDGVYTAFELLNRNLESGEVQTRGFLTVLFPTDAFAEPIVQNALKEAENSDSPLYAFIFPAGILDPHNELEAFVVTKLEGSEDVWALYVSDVTTTIDSDNATVSLHLDNSEEITILAFSEEPESRQLGPKPRIVLGYSSDWLQEKGFSASMEKPYSRRVFDEWVLTGIQSCHLETMGDVATWFNFKMSEAMEKYNYAASWLLQGALHGDSDCIKELDRYTEYTSDPEWIVTWLGQRKQHQAAIDFEDGRLTFPFDKSGEQKTEASHDSPAIASDKALRIPDNDLFESTQYTLRKLVMLWELAREEGFQDSEDNEGISLDMFISSQIAILVLKRIFYPTDRYMKAFRRASQEFEELLGFPSIEVSPLDVESVELAESDEYTHVRYLKGLCHIRRTQDDFDIDNFRSKFDLLFNETVRGKKASDIFVEIAPGIIDLLWQAFAKLGFHFYCNHFGVNYDEDFGLFDFETRSVVYNGDYFFKNVGTPSWAEVFIEFVDRDDDLNDWGDGLFDEIGGADASLLLYAQMYSDQLSDHYAMTEDDINWYWPKIDSTDEINSDIVIIQSNSRWWGNFLLFYNNISYGVTPDLKYIDELEKVRGISYAELSSVQIMKLINIATETLEDPDIGLNKVAHYILSLIWSHPDTPIEGKVLIALLNDEDIRKFGQGEDEDEDEEN